MKEQLHTRPRLISQHPVCLAFFDALHLGKLNLGATVTQNDLCRILDVGMSPLREALALLESAGYLVSRRKVGITIVSPDLEFIVAVFQLREMLELEGLRLFLERDKTDWVQRMRLRHAEVTERLKTTTRKDFMQRITPTAGLDDEFHLSFIDAFDNLEILAIYDNLKVKQRLLPLAKLALRGPTNANSAIREHLAIIDAIGRDDHADALDKMRRHMQQSMQRVLTG